MKKIMMIALLMVVAITGAKAQLLYKISGKDLKQPRTSWVPTIWLRCRL